MVYNTLLVVPGYEQGRDIETQIRVGQNDEHRYYDDYNPQHLGLNVVAAATVEQSELYLERGYGGKVPYDSVVIAENTPTSGGIVEGQPVNIQGLRDLAAFMTRAGFNAPMLILATSPEGKRLTRDDVLEPSDTRGFAVLEIDEHRHLLSRDEEYRYIPKVVGQLMTAAAAN